MHDKQNTYVYIIGNMYHKKFKIGYSNSPIERLKILQTGCPFEIELLHLIYSYAINGHKKLEKSLHYKYREKKINNEFLLSDSDIKELCNLGDYYEDGSFEKANKMCFAPYNIAWKMLTYNIDSKNPFLDKFISHKIWNCGKHDFLHYSLGEN